MRNIAIILVACTLILFGCFDNEEVPESPCYPFSLTYKIGTSSTNFEYYEYNKSNKLSSIDVGSTIYNYTYDAKGKLIKRTVSDGTYTVYSYDANGRMTSYSNYNTTNVVASKIEYTYNTSNQVTQRQTFSLVSGVLTKGTYSTYEYASTKNRNYSKRLNYSSTGVLQSTDTFQYDTKSNTFNVLTPDIPTNTTNNITQRVFTPVVGTSITYTYTYKYSAKGFPLTYSVSGTNGYSESNTYEYNNCLK